MADDPPKKRIRPSGKPQAPPRAAAFSLEATMSNVAKDARAATRGPSASSFACGGPTTAVAAAQHAAAAAAALIPAGEPCETALFRGLLEARGAALALGLDTADTLAQVEVEARVGLVHQASVARRFYPGVPGKGGLAVDTRRLGPRAPTDRRAPPAFSPGVSLLSFRGAEASRRALLARGGLRRLELVETVWMGEAGRVVEVQRRGEVAPGAGGVGPAAAAADASSLPPPRAESKRALVEHMDLCLPSCDYDLRLSVQREVPASVPAGYRERASGSRRKARESLIAPPLHPTLGCWQLDMTEVTTEDLAARRSGGTAAGGVGGGGGGAKTFEVELEMTAHGRARWLGTYACSAEAEAACRDVARQLCTWVHLVNPPAHDGGDPEDASAHARGTGGAALGPLITPLPHSDPAARAAQALCEDLAGRGGGGGGGGRHGSAFPGAMPVNLCRRHLGPVQAGRYFVTEKTDGVRQLLAVVLAPLPSGGAAAAAAAAGTGADSRTVAVLVDRSMQRDPRSGAPLGLLCKAFRGGRDVGGLGLAPGTVLDGEVVFNLHLRKHVFMVFDCLAVGGECVMGLPWSERVAKLPLAALAASQTATWGGAPGGPGGNLVMGVKTFWPRSKADALFKNFEPSTGGVGRHVYRIHPKPLVPGGGSSGGGGGGDLYLQAWHRTDGVILQPDAPYVCGTDYGLLKWKFLDTVTVDMAVRFVDGTARLACSHDGGEVDFSEHASLGWHDTARLAADYDAVHAGMSGMSSSAAIAEVGLDPATGDWFYKGLRPDKDRANALHTVLSTLLELAENVGAEELEARLLAPGNDPRGDCWETDRAGQARELLARTHRAAAEARLQQRRAKK